MLNRQNEFKLSLADSIVKSRLLTLQRVGVICVEFQFTGGCRFLPRVGHGNGEDVLWGPSGCSLLELPSIPGFAGCVLDHAIDIPLKLGVQVLVVVGELHAEAARR